MNRKRILIVSITLFFGIDFAVTAVKINNTTPFLSQVERTPSPLDDGFDLLDIKDHSLNALLFEYTILSSILGFVYWIFRVLDAKEKLETESKQKEFSEQLLKKMTEEVNSAKILLEHYNTQLTKAISKLEGEFKNEQVNNSQHFLQMNQSIKEMMLTRIHDRELHKIELRHISQQLKNLYRYLDELQGVIVQIENFLQQHHADYKRKNLVAVRRAYDVHSKETFQAENRD